MTHLLQNILDGEWVLNAQCLDIYLCVCRWCLSREWRRWWASWAGTETGLPCYYKPVRKNWVDVCCRSKPCSRSALTRSAAIPPPQHAYRKRRPELNVENNPSRVFPCWRYTPLFRVVLSLILVLLILQKCSDASPGWLYIIFDIICVLVYYLVRQTSHIN